MRTLLYRGLVAVVSAGFALVLISCASSPESPGPPVEAVQPQDNSSTPLFVPKQVERSFFSFDDESILQDMEIGSPSSLRSAASKLKKAAVSYTNAERVALSVASSIMSMVWPAEKNSIEVPPGTIEANPYTAAIESAKIGIYDENTGGSDFFTLVLPSLVLVSSTSGTNDGFYQQSQDSLLAALAMNPDSVLAKYLLACLYVRMGRNTEAAQMFAQAAAAAPDCFEIRYALADTHFALGDIDTAFLMAKELLQKFPRNIPLLKLCTEIALSRSDYLLAEQYIAQVLQQEPDNSRYLLYRIRVLVEQENYIKAVPLLDVYARTDKTSRDYLLLRARIQNEWNKNPAAATATLEEAMLLYPEDFELVLAAAELAASSGGVVRDKSAGQLAQQILLTDPDNLKALQICMEDSIQKRDWQAAYEYSSMLMSRTESLSAVTLPHISICLNLGRIDEAKRLSEELYSKEPDSDEVREIYIRTLAATGEAGKVRSLIQSMLPGASSKLKSFLYYQRSLLSSSDSEKLADLRQSLTANPRNQEPLFELYRYYYNKKDYRKAQYYLKQVVALNPSDQEILSLNAELDALLD